ncbi:MAG TPA: hypothetical protein VG964_00490 [Candidatus Saccharimonadales bacterium]|nr:hypothetical protein [Candidatus Saccharimonadales bacterium]
MKLVEQELWEILVPAAANDGAEIPVEHHRKWDDSVRAIAGGLTIMRTAKGQWIDETGKLFTEKMIPVRITCSRRQIEQIMKLTMQHYDQLATMAYRISEQALILERDQ